jgi:hypothetical protein
MRISIRLATAALAAAAIGFGGTGMAAAAAAYGPTTRLNNHQETTGADGGAKGSFRYRIDGGMLCYRLQVRGLTQPATAAHIHLAPKGVAGGVVVPLTISNAATFTTTTCVSADPQLLAAIAADPRSYYVNVHTATYPGGEVRGQLK